jgi:hypothetical protein
VAGDSKLHLHIVPNGARHCAAKDRTLKTVRPNRGTLTDASFRSSRTPTTKTRLCRLSILLRDHQGDGESAAMPCAAFHASEGLSSRLPRMRSSSPAVLVALSACCLALSVSEPFAAIR